MKKHDEAFEYHKKALEIRKLLDSNHPSLAFSYHNLAATYIGIGKSKSALKYQLKSLEILESLFDEDHPDLALSYRNLALIYLELEDFERARQYGEKAVQMYQKNFPKGHPLLKTAEDSLQYIKGHIDP